MTSPSVLLRGAGWKLSGTVDLRDPGEVRAVPADRPEELAALLEWLDDVASTGRRDVIAAGFLTYEAGVVLEGSAGLFRPPPTPLAWFGLFDVSKAAREGDEPATRNGAARADAENAAPGPPSASGSAERAPAGWAAAVAEVREGIARGDVYQVNLTRRVVRDASVGARELADRLWSDNPVPWAICVDTGEEAVVSNSPELFLDVSLGSRRVASAPIKGTVPRLRGGPDESAREALLRSEKDAAEHLMIVDLIRNDLGRVCEAGSVHVPAFRAVRSFRHLHHLESTVAGRLRGEVRISDVLRATLPGGSITGAPKRAALGFIRRLEPVARGPYTGAAGYVRGDGTAVFNVAIRTARVSGGEVAYHAGGGVVWDSDPQREWEEAETKSLEFFRALASRARPGEVA